MRSPSASVSSLYLARLAALLAVVTGVVLVTASCGSDPGTNSGTFPPGTDGSVDGSDPNPIGFVDSGLPSADANGCDGCTTPAVVCGDGVVGPGEECDDGNARPGDGCSGVCKIEKGYSCPTPGVPCVATFSATCGNGLVEGQEGCDDGNKLDGDGCSAGCQVEPGYACVTPGAPCTRTTGGGTCGDGKVDTTEGCDDGNKTPNDGCSATCAIEPGYTCPTPGQPCVPLLYCGDGKVTPSLHETCDDGNTIPGDGCSGLCATENGYACTTPGSPCVRIWVCGNGKVDPGEACDDGNNNPNDGCAPDCTFVEPGYTCPKAPDGTGGTCTKLPAPACGDGILTQANGEQCDDGNKAPNDGCGATCQIEPGYDCKVPGKACTKIGFCGDLKTDVQLGEECDDGVGPKGVPVGGDGCSATCTREPNYACPTPPAGGACISTVVCGNGIVSGTEQCDDGNKLSGDGCSSTCQLEAGWSCGSPGTRCIAAKCGDGILAGNEQCDDGDKIDTNGCSNTCKLNDGYACTNTPGATTVCTPTVCGDKKIEGFEQCDDGNRQPFDGCDFNCRLEPACANGTCSAVCGDGLKFPQEACDDGNNIDGDGCSHDCKIEDPTAWKCVDQSVSNLVGGKLQIPVVYRDMRYHDCNVDTGAECSSDTNPVPGHPDFNRDALNHANSGLVESTLGADGRPVFKTASNSLTTAANFDWWYHDKTGCDAQGKNCTPNPYADTVFQDASGKQLFLLLDDQGNNVFGHDYSSFFPIDGLGWNDPSFGAPQVSYGHNFSFTSEIHIPFTYTRGEKFAFTGDDDVWVFVNGHLVIDLGGCHGASSKSVTLDSNNEVALGLAPGKLYDIAMFQAERHTNASHYQLTLSNFAHLKTVCTPICGDGKLEGDEVCDDGKNDGSYGSCAPGCKARGPYCGDATVQGPNTTPKGPEACDDGVNQVTYGGSSRKCGPGCVIAPYCGDGVASNGEACDDAVNDGNYGHCGKNCGPAQRCGDGIKNGPEACDDGINNGATGDACSANCQLLCGNGKLDPGEQCDDPAGNTGGYGKCNPNCTLGPHCGDGTKNGTEACDDGKNDGSYGTCNPNCSLAGYCGDGTTQTPPETCDLGTSNSATAYGKTSCTNRCSPAPYCGDKQVDSQFGETCDDGVNSGNAGSCTPDCKAFVALTTCGNGTVDPGEQCDHGTGKNGASGDSCDAHCRNTCGNGIKDPGETCDDGVNDGSYGGCTPTCQFAAYCGDGIKNGNEACDKGTSNVTASTAYGPGVCTTACTFAPYCGDGRVESKFGETCDGTVNCSSTCTTAGPH